MRLYSGSVDQFIKDNMINQIADKLKNTFFSYYHYYPSPSEEASWRNSLRAVSQVFQYSGLNDNGILLEYQLPLSSKRLDCLVCGKNQNSEDSAVIIELKQWSACEKADGANEVMTYVGGGKRDVLHPSAQVGQYQLYLEDTHTAFYEGENPVVLNSCSYLHNYNFFQSDPILDTKFNPLLERFPVFSADDVDNLSEFLIENVNYGGGLEILQRIEESKYRPNKKLMRHVGQVIRGNPQYVLLDEQLIVYDRIFSSARKGFHDKRKTTIIIKGGPGTGKSVIALNVMADLLLEGYNAHYATGSRAFTETLREIIGRRGAVQFKYFNSYMQAEQNEIDVLICDEAHRIRDFSHNRFTKKEHRTNIPQTQEIINASKVSVFFIDDDQVVRPNEIGSTDLIREMAYSFDCKIYEYELETQFRCAGSDAFVNWINNTLGVKRTANVIWEGSEGFEFKIFDSPYQIEQALYSKIEDGNSARMTAGFVWPWSKTKPDGTLEEDVQLDGYSRPWNARPEAKRLAPNIPKATLWAHDPNGFKQVGCVYTAQGFEFDYVGVIFGDDLIYDLDEQTWKGYKARSFDHVVKRSGDKFIDLVKNTYRVLLSRGMKGCYVHFMDKNTERFFKSRMQN